MSKPRGKLTFKQKQFVKEYVKNKGNGQQAALKTYDVKDEKVASVVASENLAKPSVQEELKRILSRGELQLHQIVSNIAENANAKPVKGYSDASILKANETLLKLHGVLTERKTVTNYNMNVNFDDMSVHELQEMRKRKLQETDSILSNDD